MVGQVQTEGLDVGENVVGLDVDIGGVKIDVI